MDFLIDSLKGRSFPHKHKNYEIIVYAKNESILHTRKKDFSVSPGKIMIIPPDTIHWGDAGECEQIYINGNLNSFFSLTEPVLVLDNSNNEGLQLAKFIYANRYSDSEYAGALIHALALFLLRNIPVPDAIFSATKKISEYITNNFFDSNINLKQLLISSGYSEDYIRAQFKFFNGKTPNEFLTDIRINHACRLMELYKSSLSLSDIAERCGYTDYAYFSRKFRHIIGISPREYIKKQRPNF